RVAEAFGGDEPGARALALDERVAEERGRVHHALDLLRYDAFLVEEPADAGHDTALRRVRGGELLMAERDRADRVVNDDVGERAADVDAERVAAHVKYPS